MVQKYYHVALREDLKLDYDIFSNSEIPFKDWVKKIVLEGLNQLKRDKLEGEFVRDKLKGEFLK